MTPPRPEVDAVGLSAEQVPPKGEGMILRTFMIHVDGFSGARYHARSRGKALAKAWGDYVNHDGGVRFGDFLKIARAYKVAEEDPRFGEAMTVGGRPALYVSHNCQYIQFVRPGCDEIMNSHPYDVEPPHARRGTPYYSEPSA